MKLSKIILENKKYVESLHKYESISYNYAILNIIGVITLISAFQAFTPL